MSAVVAVILGKERRMVNRLRMAGATSPAQARTLAELGVSEGLILHRLRDRAVVRHAGPDRYYLDEESWDAVRRSRRRAIHISWLVALIILLAILFGRILIAPVPQ
jgi:hypothetical protein